MRRRSRLVNRLRPPSHRWLTGGDSDATVPAPSINLPLSTAPRSYSQRWVAS